MQIIGKKESFAIQYEMVKKTGDFLTAKLCFWINGMQFGNYEDSSPIYPPYRGLVHCLDSKEHLSGMQFRGKNPQEIWDILIPFNDLESFLNAPEEKQNELIGYDKYIADFGEAFNNFPARLFTIGNEYHFIWKMQIEKDHPFYDLFADYGNELKHGIVSYEELKSEISEFYDQVREYVT